MSRIVLPAARGRIRLVLLSLAAVAILAAGGAACGRSSDPPPVALALKTTPTTVAPESIHSEAAATLLATELLDRIVLPAGTTTVATSPAPVLDQPFQVPATSNLALAHRFARVPATFSATEAYFGRVVPSGFVQTGSGQSGFAVPGAGNPGSPNPPKVTESDVTDTLSSPPAGVNSAEILVGVAFGDGAATFVRIDTQVTWTPEKPTTASVPPRDRVAVVSVVHVLAPNQIRAFDPHRAVVSDPATLASLAASADALTPALPGVESCPADLGTRYVVAFGTTEAAAPDVVFTAGACDHVTVTANGQQLGVLADSTAFQAAYLSALGLPAAG
jgi:hypothetical protein